MIARAGTEIEIDSPRDFETEAWRTDVRAVDVGRAADRAPLLLDAEVDALLVASIGSSSACGSSC